MITVQVQENQHSDILLLDVEEEERTPMCVIQERAQSQGDKAARSAVSNEAECRQDHGQEDRTMIDLTINSSLLADALGLDDYWMVYYSTAPHLTPPLKPPHFLILSISTLLSVRAVQKLM